MFASYNSVVFWVFKVGDMNYSYQYVGYLCVREEDECCQDRNWVVSQ